MLPQSYYTHTFRRVLTPSVDSCAEIEYPFSGVTNSGRVWRKVPESDARSVMWPYSGVTNCGTVWRKVHESDARSVMWPNSGVTNSGRVWRKVPESDARSVSTPPWDVQSEPRFFRHSSSRKDAGKQYLESARDGVIPTLLHSAGAVHWPLSLQLAAI